MVEEIGLDLEGFGSFGEMEVLPEGVGQGFEDDKLGVVARAQELAIGEGGVA